MTTGTQLRPVFLASRSARATLDPLYYRDWGLGTRDSEITDYLRTLAVPVPSPWSLVPSFLRNGDCLRSCDYSPVEERRLPDRDLLVERRNRRNGIHREDDLVATQCCAAGGVQNADVGHRAADDHGLNVLHPQLMVQWRSKETIVPELLNHALPCLRGQFVDDLPSP